MDKKCLLNKWNLDVKKIEIFYFSPNKIQPPFLTESMLMSLAGDSNLHLIYFTLLKASPMAVLCDSFQEVRKSFPSGDLVGSHFLAICDHSFEHVTFFNQ